MSELHFHDPQNVTNPEHSQHHVVPPSVYLMVFATLLFFTILTIYAADWDMGLFNPIVALAIATVKAMVVVLFFMHVKYQSNLIKLAIGSGFFAFLVLMAMSLTDYISRGWGRW